MRIRIQILASKEKVLKQAHISYILACHLKIDAVPGPVPDPVYYLDADPDFLLMRIRIWMRIQVTKMMRIRMWIRIHNTAELNQRIYLLVPH